MQVWGEAADRNQRAEQLLAGDSDANGTRVLALP